MKKGLLLLVLALPAGSSAATRVVAEAGQECRHVWRNNGGVISSTSCTEQEYSEMTTPPVRPGHTWVRSELFGAFNTTEKTIVEGDAFEDQGSVYTLLNGKLFALEAARVVNGRVMSNRTYDDVEITENGDIVEKAPVAILSPRAR